ncbi:hypothetical protein BUALT_Bualt05G0022600 [Buddleja alternifolia]|uniref:Sulfotransferase n=1 Tax=Buddleja alternifolia TaxID=168488 RepID=A0AAV6XPG2_9LAMI|nr:hypothetical protein BUALT_Bualt05G0022600 [Buddleja alternifolia]
MDEGPKRFFEGEEPKDKSRELIMQTLEQQTNWDGTPLVKYDGFWIPIAEFIDFPFSLEEEEQGVIKQISEFCSFENLSNLEVNKTWNFLSVVENSSIFRKGEVGDSKNYLTPVMAERIEKIIESKLEGSGLTFKNYYHSKDESWN